jgi:putative transposase
MPRLRYRVQDDHYPHFITCTVLAWLPAFSQPAFVDIVLESWRFLQRKREIDILAYVILENHLHWIGFGPALGQRVNEFKSFTAKSILQAMKERGYLTPLQQHAFYKAHSRTDQDYQFWTEGSHPQVITSDAMMWQKIEYIHSNPLRRRYVDDPLAWRYSSARNYAGMPGLIDVVTDWQ